MEPDSTAVPLPTVAFAPDTDPVSPSRCYRCPGESDDITDSVHLARLSSFFHKCRLCQYRSDIVRLAPSLQKQWSQLLLAPEPTRLFQANGVRGQYLNQLTRNEASQVAAAFTSTLRDVAEIWRARHPSPLPPSRWLKVVFGHDARPSSPDLANAAATTLRQHGCELVDLSWSTRPQVDAALRTSGADGVFYVTGHCSAVGWNGFDLVGPDGIAWSQGGMLDIVEQRFHQPCPRIEREAAPQSSRDAMGETLAALRGELHGLRPLRVVIETCEPTLEQVLQFSVPDWPGQITLRTGGVGGARLRASDGVVSSAPTHPKTSGRVAPGISPLTFDSKAKATDVAFRIGEDARQCEMWDEFQQPVTDQQLLFGLGELLLDEHPHVDVVLSDALFDRYGCTVERCGPGYLVFHRGGSHEEQLVRTMHSLNSSLGLDGAGRYWIRREGHIHCNGLLTITMILKSLSQSDRAVSEWLKR